MSKTLDLREYQEDILDRIKERTRSTEDASARSRLGVRAGTMHWLVHLDDISEVLPVPEIYPVPLAKPWFLGITNVRGNLYGVSDLAQFAGESPAVTSIASRILLTHPKYKAQAGLLVDAIVGLRTLDDMEAQDASAPGAWMGRVFRDAAGETWQEVDIRALLVLPEFMKIASN
ncbi:MAG: chemotaxis protein CheW [Methylobacillus sp.]|jgi:twitching motility protein PilI|nr:chemotaxis protein CheW [Methylobacillus sp.]